MIIVLGMLTVAKWLEPFCDAVLRSANSIKQHLFATLRSGLQGVEHPFNDHQLLSRISTARDLQVIPSSNLALEPKYNFLDRTLQPKVNCHDEREVHSSTRRLQK